MHLSNWNHYFQHFTVKPPEKVRASEARIAPGLLGDVVVRVLYYQKEILHYKNRQISGGLLPYFVLKDTSIAIFRKPSKFRIDSKA